MAKGRLRDKIGRVLAHAARAGVFLAGLVFMAAAGGVLVFTQTATGRDVIRSSLERVLSGTVHGRVRIGPITGGNLLTRVRLASFLIEDSAGAPFLQLRDVRVEYNPLGFLTGRYHLKRMEVGRLTLDMVQDTSGSWNFQRIFASGPDSVTSSGSGGGTRLLVTDAHVAGGTVDVVEPWSTGLRGTAADSALRAALAGQATWNVRRGPGGRPEQEFRADSIRGGMPLLRLADPQRPMRLEFAGIAARLTAVSQPLDVTAFTGSAEFGDSVHVQVADIETPESKLSGRGWVVPSTPLAYRFDLDADPLGFADLRWLPVPVPRTGGGPVRIVLRSAGEVPVVEAHDGDMRSGDSRVRGSFELHVGDTPRLASYDVQVAPLRLALVDRLLDRPTLIDGLVSGRLDGSGPIDLLGMDGELSFRPLPGADSVAAPPSKLTLHGAMGLVEPRRLGALKLDFDGFSPRWMKVLGIDTRQLGRLSGTATLDGVVGRHIDFTADLTQRVPGDTTSHVVARGGLDLADTARVDVTLDARPLSLSVIDPYFPKLDMVGVVRGPIDAHGCLCDLQARADLRTPRGHLTFDGRFDLVAERRRYDAQLTARDLQLRQWMKGAPDTKLAVRGHVQGEGTDPADLQATFDLEVLPSTFAGARVDSSLLRFRVLNGLATADTFAIRTDVGRIRGRGAFGLARDRSGSLILDIEAPDLALWNRWIVPGRGPVAADTSAEDLLAQFPGRTEPGGGPEGETAALPDTLAGALTARGVVYGNPEAFAFGGTVTARAPGYGALGADSADLTLDVASATSLDSMVIRGKAWGVRRGELAIDSASVRVARRGAHQVDLQLTARRDSSAAVELGAGLDWTRQRTIVELKSLDLGLGTQRIRLEHPTRITWGDSGLSVDSLVLAGAAGGSVRADGTVPTAGTARFDLAVRRVDLANVATFIAFRPVPTGRLTASVKVRGTGSAPVMDATVMVDSPQVEGHAYDRLGGSFHYEDRSTRVQAALSGPAGDLASLAGSVKGDLAPATRGDRFPEDPFDLQLKADSLPLELVAAPFPSLQSVVGTARGEVGIGGGPNKLNLSGAVQLTDGAVTLPDLGMRYVGIAGSVRFQGTRAILDSLRFRSQDEGSGTLAGSVDLAHPTDPGFDLDLAAHGLHAMNRRKATANLDGTMHLAGTYRRPTVTGKVRVSDGTVRFQEFLRQQQVVDLTDPQLYALIDTMALSERRLIAAAQNPFLQNLKMDLSATVGPNLWVRSQQMSVEISGDVDIRMDRAQGDLTLFGPVTLVRGSYTWTPTTLGGVGELYSRQLKITRGTIAFVGTPGMDPNLDITAQRQVQTPQGALTVTAHVSGTMLRPQLTLSSEPSLSQSDQVCVLLFNRPCAATGAYGQQGSFAGQLASEQLLGQVSSELSSLLVGQSPLDYLDIRRTPVGQGIGNGGESSLLSATEVEAGVYLSPSLFLTVTYPLGLPLPEGTLSWRFLEHWTLEGRMQYRFNQEVARITSSTLDQQQLYGLFLFRDWSF
ncbi:MAG: translocation/assembly module TamB domain-containing protein [Candidatus Palauibacterales bacterium]|nr:translocation/assembly module TamB domain-containing protein [Candidatus Palauibacterales bacterium]